MRALHRQAIGLNMRREHFALHRDIQELRGRLIGVGIMLVCVAGLDYSVCISITPIIPVTHNCAAD